MKNIFVVLFLIFAGSSTALADLKEDPKTEMLVPTLTTKKIDVTVSGLVCDFCARGLEKLFDTKEEVEKIEVDLAGGKVVIFLKPGQQLDDSEVTKTINDNGISVEKITRE